MSAGFYANASTSLAATKMRYSVPLHRLYLDAATMVFLPFGRRIPYAVVTVEYREMGVAKDRRLSRLRNRNPTCTTGIYQYVVEPQFSLGDLYLQRRVVQVRAGDILYAHPVSPISMERVPPRSQNLDYDRN